MLFRSGAAHGADSVGKNSAFEDDFTAALLGDVGQRVYAVEGVTMCDYCHNIQEWKKFNAPKDYLACIEYIQQLVTNGGFELLEEESTCPLNQVETEDGWADEIMVHMVRCKHCGQVFTCVVNTYRGSGSFKKGKG